MVIASVLLAALSFTAWRVFRETRVPQNQNEVFSRVIELEKWGRYDRAAQVLKTWMIDSRRDASRDDFLYFEVAMVYIAKAYKKPAARDESIHQAELNLEKASAVYNEQGVKGIDVMLFEIGGGYEFLGDISQHDKCRLYDKARQAFERELPLIKGDTFNAYGHTTPLEPVRADIRKHLSSANDKYLKAGCEAH